MELRRRGEGWGGPREFYCGKESHKGKGAAEVGQRDCRRHSCCLLRVWGAGLGPAWRRVEFWKTLLGIEKEV